MQNSSNEELVKIAGATVIGTPSGLKSQEAQAELSKRLMVSLNELKKSLDESNTTAKKFNDAMLYLTIILMMLGLLQIYSTVLTSSSPWQLKIWFIVVPLGVVVYLPYRYKNLK